MRSSGDKRTAPNHAAPRARTRKQTGRLVIAALVVAVLGAVMHGASAASDPPSTYAGAHLTPRQAMQYAYSAGFHSENQLVTVTAIGIAESGLVTGTRNWHPEFGYRPASDVIGVQGPASVWNGNRQMHSDRGVWQISSHFWPQYSDAQTDDPAKAAKVMFAISHNGTDFSPWNTFTGGDADGYANGSHNGWPALGPIARDVIAAGGGGTPNVTPKPDPKPDPKPAPKPRVVKPKPRVAKPKPRVAKPKPTVPDRVAPVDTDPTPDHTWEPSHHRHHHRHHHWGGWDDDHRWDNDGRWDNHGDDGEARWSTASRCHR
jgi:hypothetical protein